MKLKVNIKKIGKSKHQVQEAVYEIPGHPGNVRELIEAVTTECVTLYNQRMDDKELLRCLTSDEINDQAASGRVGFGVNYGDRKADPESAVNHAIQSFEDGIYRIFLDDRALEQLEEKILLTEGSSLTFVRLTMLAGRMW